MPWIGKFAIVTTLLLPVTRLWSAVPAVDYFSASVDADPGAPSQGTYTSDLANDLVALGNGWIVLALKNSNSIRVVHAPSGTVDKTIALTASPTRLVHDPDRGLIYATLSGANSLARVDLSSSTVAYIPLHWYGIDVALGNCGQVIVATQASSPWWDAEFEVVDGPGGTVLNRTLSGDGFTIDYDRINQRLISGVLGSSPSSIFDWAYNPTTHTFTETSTLWNAGSNGQDIAVSPDGLSTAFACGAGNGSPSYSIFDFQTGNWGTSFGSWNVGPYPSAVAFSPGGSYLLATNRNDLIVYSRSTHILQLAYLSAVGSSNLYRVAYGRGGRFVYGLEVPYSGSTAKVFWAYTGLTDAAPPSIPNYCGSPTPSPTQTPSRTISATLTQSPTFSASPSVTETRTITTTFSESPTFSVSPSSTSTRTASPTRTATRTATDTATASPTRTISGTWTQSRTLSPSPSATPTPQLAPFPYLNDLEAGVGAVAINGLWHRVDTASGNPYALAYSGAQALWYGQDATGNYSTGAPNNGWTSLPTVQIPPSETLAALYFASWYQTETTGTSYDRRWVQVSVNGGAFINLQQLSGDAMGSWRQVSVPLGAYAGSRVQLRFFFDTVDSTANNYRGWYVDDLQIRGPSLPTATPTASVSPTRSPSPSVTPTVSPINNSFAPTATASPTATSTTQGTATASPLPPRQDQLSQPYPNPWRQQGDLHLSFQLAKDAQVSLAVFDLRGQRLVLLLDERRSAGRYSLAWNGEKEQGGGLASGQYYVVLKADGVPHVQRFLVLR